MRDSFYDGRVLDPERVKKGGHDDAYSRGDTRGTRQEAIWRRWRSAYDGEDPQMPSRVRCDRVAHAVQEVWSDLTVVLLPPMGTVVMFLMRTGVMAILRHDSKRRSAGASAGRWLAGALERCSNRNVLFITSRT
jgi:hypothetical protein